MKAMRSALFSIAGLGGLVAALLLGVVVWFFAPAVLGVSAWWLVLLLSTLPLLIWLGVLVWLTRRAQQRDAALVAGATAVDPEAAKADAASAAAREEERIVASRLGEALAAMKAAGGGKGGFLYERPWYVLIGPPGSGKTTAIRNSGLDFPLAEGRVSGVGGTRNCDWWIAEQAVLIDTAGRYTTQDSDAAADKAGWERFLDLLRKQRPRQPLNGVIVAMGADLLSQLDASGREEHARAVRRRVRELEQRLGQRLPVYFLVSKADLIVGFTEFFDDLDREHRDQVWGMTFAPDAGAEGHAAQVSVQFQGLLGRLQDRVLQRLQAERGAEQRARIAGFPTQFASLQAPLTAFVTAAFGGSSLDPAPYLRGLYFTSGTQEGTPIDRLTGALSRTFGLDPRRPAAVMGQKGRSYFLGRLLRDVVFNEARLAVHDRGHARRKRLLQWGTAAVAAIALVLGIGLGWNALRLESQRQDQVQAALGAAQQAAAGLPTEALSARDDLASALPYLDAASALPPAASGPSGALGLSQEPKLHEAGQLAYQHALERVLLPRLLLRLETQIQQGMQKPSFLYLATRVYLMLGRQGPMDAGLIQEWMAADWQQLLPGTSGAASRDALMAHLSALLAGDFNSYPLDGTLVDEARRVFSRLPMGERVYARLRSSATDVPGWRPAQALGPAGQRLFVMRDGSALDQAAVPGLFTVDGLHRALLPQLPAAIAEAASESWVLGPDAAASSADTQSLEGDVLRRYAQDYIAAWDRLIGQLDLAPLGNPTQAAEALNLLGAPQSPMRDLLRSMARQLSPGTPLTPGTGAAQAAESTAASAASAATGLQAAAAALPSSLGAAAARGAAQASQVGRVAEVLGARAPVDPSTVVGQQVEAHFQPLRDAAGAPLDAQLAILSELYVQMAQMATSAPGSLPAAGGGLDPAQRLLAAAKNSPQPLGRWLAVAAQTSAAMRSGGTRASVAAAAAQQLAPFCQGVQGRFPFRADPSAPDMPMDDFVRLFGPGGAFDQFFNQTLRSFVDTSRRPWRPVAAGGAPAPVSASDVAQFQRAAAIRDAFFPPALPGQAPAPLRFELLPKGLDSNTPAATLDVAGAVITLQPGATTGRGIPLQWPSPGSISLRFGAEPPVVSDGPWAALRFVAKGKLERTAVPDRMRLTLQQGAHTAEFELRTGSVMHPFGLSDLSGFACPRLSP